MKKFLPFILFIMAFSAVVAWQVGIKKFQNDVLPETNSEYAAYERLFMESKFTGLDKNSVIPSKLSSPLVIVNFWASWCIPCLDEMPSMMNLKKSLPSDQVQIIAVNTDEDEPLNNIQKIKQKLKIKNEFIIISDNMGKITSQFNVTAIPVSIIYLHGKVVHVSNGPMDFYSEEFREKVKSWLKT